MAVAKRAFNAGSKDAQWRPAAYASININFKKMLGDDATREDRLAWIEGYLNMEKLRSMTDLTDDQLGAVAGEMKRLTGGQTTQRTQPTPTRPPSTTIGNVVRGEFGREPAQSGDGDKETIFLSSPEMVYTIEKLLEYIAWDRAHRDTFLTSRFGTTNLRMLTFKKSKVAVNTFLRIAAHRDIKRSKGPDQPVSRTEINKYIPKLKAQLRIDQ